MRGAVNRTEKRNRYLCAFHWLELGRETGRILSAPHNAQRRAAETISVEELFYDVHRELVSLSTLIDLQTVVDHFQPFATANDLKAYLQELFAPVWEDRWVKSPKKKKPKSTAPKKRIEGGHTSIYRILRAAKQKVPKDV